MTTEAPAPNGNGRTKMPRWALALSILIPAVSSAGAAWYSLFIGNPEAKEKSEKTWTTLSDAYRKLQLNVVHMQGQLEGYNNAKLMLKIEALEKENQDLKEDKEASSVASSKPVAVPDRCPPGWVRIRGKCTKSRQAIAKEVRSARAKVLEAKRRLREERRKRRDVERKARRIEVQSPAPAPSLPSDLDEASKKVRH